MHWVVTDVSITRGDYSDEGRWCADPYNSSSLRSKKGGRDQRRCAPQAVARDMSSGALAGSGRCIRSSSYISSSKVREGAPPWLPGVRSEGAAEGKGQLPRAGMQRAPAF